ncbi:MAG: alpha/beta fold hydrolase [Chromatiaceae bacterium]|jgi:pimeloyl-ACP methyl ester carboxylesterase|nr:alpha/beta fold hydrolase [Chromatiaceae bacterium]
MSRFREGFVICPGQTQPLRMAYTDWGDIDNPRLLICVHGLTRCGRDFDTLAEALADDYRVICPDVIGRGLSDWLEDHAGYGIPTYAQHMLALLAHLGAAKVDWLGTSMGGLIGMALAAQPESPIQRLILNDVGPEIPGPALARIAHYVGRDERWDSLAEVMAQQSQALAPFGNLSPAQWHRILLPALVQDAEGRWRTRYDPRIALSLRAIDPTQNPNLWPLYEAINCPTLAIHGADSDLLTTEVWQAMATRGPRATLAEIPNVGHAPPFLDEAQIAIVRDYLLG